MLVQIAPVDFLVPASHQGRDHRLISLPNGLKALLISDPADDVAAAALSVAAGSFCDPPEIPGLAHLCEHLLFLGTKEFPDPRSYFGTITAAGGSFNAHTTGKETSFYFEIPVTSMRAGKLNSGVAAEHRETLVFDYVLRNFASFFKEPLFSDSGVKQEISTVHEEHTANITHPGKLFYHALRLLANPLHPFSRFATGTYSTLSGRKPGRVSVKSNLVSYYESCYSSERMVLVIRGPQSLNHLQKLVGANFGDIPQTRAPKRLSFAKRTSKRASTASISTRDSLESTRSSFSHIPLFPRNALNKCLYVRSIASQIRLVFPVVSANVSIETFKRAWIGILGDESKSSLCAHLVKDENLATALTVFKQSLSWEEDVLILEIDLTKKGSKMLEAVIIAVFAYIQELIIEAPLEDISRYFKEMSFIEKEAFENSEIDPCAFSEVADIAETLHTAHKIGYQNVFQGFEPLERHFNDDSMIHEMAKEFRKASEKVLSIDNFNLLVIHPDKSVVSSLLPEQPLWQDTSVDFLHDEHYLFDYQILPINSLALYTKVVRMELPKCTFPPSNIFINRAYRPSQVTAKEHTQKMPLSPFGYTTKKQLDPRHNKPPQLLHFSNKHELWLAKQSSSKVLLTFGLRNYTLDPSPESKIAIEVLCELIGEELRYDLYPGELMGLQWGIFPGVNSTCSFYFTLSGFSRDFGKLLELIVEQIKLRLQSMFSTSYQSLKKARLAVRRKIDAFLNMNGRDTATATSYVFLEEKVWTLEERFCALEECDLEDLVMISNSFLQLQKYLSVFVQGDVSREEASHLYSTVGVLAFSSQREERLTCCDPSSFLFPPGKEFIYRKSLEVEQRTNTILFYTQLGRRAHSRVRTMGALLGHMLCTISIDEFRNARQLGYHVFGGFRLLRETIGLEISLTSGKYDTGILKEQICEFLYDWEVLLFNYSEEEFRENVIEPFQSSIMNTQEKAKNAALQVEPARGSSLGLSGERYETHKSQWEKIMTQNYLFSGQEIDPVLLESLTKQEVYTFFKKHISIKSSQRASLVLMFDSNFYASEERETFKKRIFAVSEAKNLGISLSQAGELADTYQGDINIGEDILYDELKRIPSKSSKGNIIRAVGRALAAPIMAAKSGHGANTTHLLLQKSNQKLVSEYGKEYSTKKSSLGEVLVTTAKEVHSKCALAREVSDRTLYERLQGIFRDQKGDDDADNDYIDILTEYSTM